MLRYVHHGILDFVIAVDSIVKKRVYCVAQVVGVAMYHNSIHIGNLYWLFVDVFVCAIDGCCDCINLFFLVCVTFELTLSYFAKNMRRIKHISISK